MNGESTKQHFEVKYNHRTLEPKDVFLMFKVFFEVYLKFVSKIIWIRAHHFTNSVPVSYTALNKNKVQICSRNYFNNLEINL